MQALVLLCEASCAMFVERFGTWSGSASVDERKGAIGDVAATYLDPSTSERDRSVCERIFTLFLDDPSSRVRSEMARVLATCPDAPRALIWNLSNDIPEVSAAIYQYSTMMCASTLIEAIEGGACVVQCAIARREDPCGEVVRSLVALGKPEAVVCLLENPAVLIGPVLKHEIAVRLGADPDVRAHLLEQDDLLPHTRQMLVLQLSSALTNLANDNGWLDVSRLQRVANESTNRATIDIAMHTDAISMSDYVEHLRSTNQLTGALLLRSLCMGNALLFEVAVAQLSGASMKRVQSIVDEGRLSAFKSLYKRTGLDQAAYPVFAIAITVWKEFGALHSGPGINEAVLGERAINDILLQAEAEQNIDSSLLSMLRRLAAEAARDSARSGAQQALLAAA